MLSEKEVFETFRALTAIVALRTGKILLRHNASDELARDLAEDFKQLLGKSFRALQAEARKRNRVLDAVHPEFRPLFEVAE